MSKSLKTPSSVWSKVFRRIVLQLENDPFVKRVVGDNLRSWKGVPGDKAPFEPKANAPVVRLTPQPRNVDWYSPDMQCGDLWVQVELGVQSLCIDDMADLWDILVNAITASGPRSIPWATPSHSTWSTSAPRRARLSSATPRSIRSRSPNPKVISTQRDISALSSFAQ